MLPPPTFGDPYEQVPQGTPNRGSIGVLLGWDSITFFLGQVAPQAWNDLDAAIAGGILV